MAACLAGIVGSLGALLGLLPQARLDQGNPPAVGEAATTERLPNGPTCLQALLIPVLDPQQRGVARTLLVPSHASGTHKAYHTGLCGSSLELQLC